MNDAERLATYLHHLKTAPATHWTHIVHTDHHHGLVSEWVTKSLTSTPEEALTSRIRRLRATPPARGWSQDGMTLHIHTTNPDRDTSITYLPAHAYTHEWREYWGVEEDRAPEGPSVMDVPLPGLSREGPCLQAGGESRWIFRGCLPRHSSSGSTSHMRVRPNLRGSGKSV